MNNGRWRNGGDGNDVIDLRWQAPWDVRDNADGGAGNDIIYGNMADNDLRGGNGDDNIHGESGNDDILGGSGDDDLFGGDGNDDLYGQSDDDLLEGNSGKDYLNGGSGNDWLFGGEGSDTLQDETGDGDDHMFGDGGNDLISTSSGGDKVYGGSGTDWVIVQNAGSHLFDAGLVLSGGSGTDTLELRPQYGTSFTIIGLGDHITGFEVIDIEDTSAGELILSFRDVITTSDTDHLRIDGDWHDDVRLENNVAGDSQTGGTWVQGVTNVLNTSESFAQYSYQLNGQVLATVSIDTDIDVVLV